MAKKKPPDFGGESGPPPHSVRWEFGEFALDESRRELRFREQIREIEPKPLDMLMLFLRHPRQLITKDDLLGALWKERIVVEAVLTNCISKLRIALGDEAQDLLKNIHSVGYRLDCEVRLLDDPSPGGVEARLAFKPGDQPTKRPHWALVRRLGKSGECWLAEHVKTHEQCVYKFAADATGLTVLKREVTITRWLQQSLAHRDAFRFAEITNWNVEDDPPWYVEMAYYSGGTLQEWFESRGGADQIPLSLRLELLADLAEAVADMHSLLVIHKDLKPANILIAVDDEGRPGVRIIDFGSGVLLDPSRLTALDITRMGLTQANDGSGGTAGTPLYYAPEVLLGQPATLKADIYALGVILYQCIVGNFRRQLAPGWELEVADELLREDIASACDVDPERRLADAGELARNLRRLDERRQQRNDQIRAMAEAEQASRALERLKARRVWQRLAVGALAAGFAASTLLYYDARVARHRAELESQRAQTVSDFLNQSVLAQINSGDHPIKNLTVKQLLDSASNEVGKRFGSQPDVAARIYESIGHSYLSLEDIPAAQANLEQALQLRERIEGAGSANAVRLAAEMVGLKYPIGQLPQFIDQYESIERIGQQQLGPDDADVLQLHVAIARGRIQLGEWVRGAQALDAALKRVSTAASPDQKFQNLIEMALGHVEVELGEYADAEKHLNAVIDRTTRLHGPDHLDIAKARLRLGRIAFETAHYDEAESQLDAAMKIATAWGGDASDYILNIRLYQAQLQIEQGRPEEAVPALIKMLEQSSAEDSSGLDQSFTERKPLAEAYQRMGRLADAEASMQRALIAASKSLGEQHPWTRAVRIGLADILRDEHRDAEAWNMLDRVPAVRLDDLPSNHPYRAELARVRGLLQADAGNREEARKEFTEALRVESAALGSGSWRTKRLQSDLALAKR